VGGTAAGSRNVISGNQNGVQITFSPGPGAPSTTNNLVQGNFIGTDPTGVLDIGNGSAGVNITNASGNTIGGTVATARNVISGNDSDGVLISGGVASSNHVQGNFIGPNVNGNDILDPPPPVPTANPANYGIRIAGAVNNTIGGTAAGAGNVISANRSRGVEISGATAAGNAVQGNFIGTDLTGAVDLGNGFLNGGSGILINGADNNTVGGTSATARNIISGNGRQFGIGGFLSPGVEIAGSGGTGNLVQGNYIGLDVTGGSSLGNLGEGVVIFGSPGNTIGGTGAGARNAISGNGLVGIEISGTGATGNLVQGNFVGTDATGTLDRGNGNSGVFIGSASNVVGGTTGGARNVISGNGAMGIEIADTAASANLVQGNYIGTNTAGTADVGNTQYGVYINGAANNTVGGTYSGARNLISGNDTGVFINAANGNAVRGNYIGTEATGATALGNSFDGVRIGGEASNNDVGGTAGGAGNTIAFNGGDGVRIDTGTGNAVLSNSIHSNNELGIDLANDAADTNDVGDPDTGANNKQNFPVVASAQSGSIRLQGTLNTVPAAPGSFRLEFFTSPACDVPSLQGEGKTFLGSASVTIDVNGNASFNSVFYVNVVVGEYVTATATDPANNTSEFSGCRQIVAGPPIVSPTPSPTPAPTTAPSYYRPVTPARVLDTRFGIGGPGGAINGGTSRAVQIAGAGGVPATGATTVVLNVTVTQPTTPGFLTVYPSDAPLPVASNLNFKAAQTVPNLVTVRIGADGKVKAFVNAGAAHVIFDVAGWYGQDPAGGTRYNPLDPIRILDTRDGTGGIGSKIGPGPGNARIFTVTGKGGVPATATAVILNVTVTQPTAASYLTVYPGNEALPTASNLNYVAGQTVPNLVIVKLSPSGQVKIYNNTGQTHVIFDVAGWYEPGAGATFTGGTPTRLLDTRNGTGGFLGKVPPGGEVALKVGGAGGVPEGVSAVALNVTVTEPTTSGFLTVYPSGTTRPVVSNLNFVAGDTVPNAVIVRVGGDGYIRIFNSSGSSHVVVDVAGWYE
jgi:hypothetical protein